MHINENRAHFKKPNKFPENVHGEAHELDIHEKDFKITVLNMFKSYRKTQTKN